VPIPRGLAEALDPIRRPLAANRELARAYERWSESRAAFNSAIARLDAAAVQRGWQRDYMLGLRSTGRAFAAHQTKLSLRPFRRQP
jgi:anti-sigma factor RsiW